VTALYGLLILEAGFQWYYATLIFCSQGDSRLSLFFGSAAGALSIPPTITIISIVVENLGFLLANGLMVLSIRLFIQFVSNSLKNLGLEMLQCMWKIITLRIAVDFLYYRVGWVRV